MEQTMLVSWFLQGSKNARHHTHCSSFRRYIPFLELRLFKENVEYLGKMFGMEWNPNGSISIG